MKKGFTLSEVLITLGIVGIVAVLTIPAIMKNYKEKVYITQLKKFYGQLSEATQAIIDDEQSDDFYTTTGGVELSCSDINSGVCEKGAGYFFNKYFKIVQNNCGQNSKCIGSNYTNASGQAIPSPKGNYCVQTANGVTMCSLFNPRVGGIDNNPCLSVMVDINGPSEPNTTGKDVFAIDIHKDGSLSDYNSGCGQNNKGCDPTVCNTQKDSLFTASCGCLNSVIEAGWKYTN